MKNRMLLMVGGLLVGLAVMSCGGGEKATPAPAPTATPRPAATVAPQPTATPRPAATVAPQLTATPRPAATTAPASTPAQATPATRQGDKAVVGLDIFGEERLVPYNANTNTINILSPLYDYVFYVDPATQEFRPGLAASWTVAPDGKKWTIKVRDDVKFSDGSELTAADVKFTIEQLASPPSPANTNSFRTSWAQAIGSIEQTGKYELAVNFKQFFAGFAEQSSDYFHQAIMSKSHFEKVGESGYENRPLGSGPYALESRVIGDRYLFKAVARHWRYGVPGFKELTLFRIPEATTRLAALRTGQVDAVPVPINVAKQAKSLPGFTVVKLPEAYDTGVWFGGLVPPEPKYNYDPKNPFLKLDLRKALNLAVNRQEIIATMYEGDAEIATVGPWTLPGWRDLKPYPYDPVQAKQLLASAGYPNGMEFTAWSFTIQPENPDLLLTVCSYWERINVKCKIRPTEFGAFRGPWRSLTISGDVYILGSGPSLDYEVRIRSSGTRTVAPTLSGWYTPETADLIDALATMPDPAERTKAFRRIGQVLYDQYMGVPLVVGSYFVVTGPKVDPKWSPLPRFYVGGWETIRPR